MKSYYDILGVTPNSTLAEVKKAYRKKAIQLHPDRNPSPNAQEAFMKLDAAYDYLVALKKGKEIKPTYDFVEILNTIFQEAAMDEVFEKKKRKRGKLAAWYMNEKNRIKSKQTGVATLGGFFLVVFSLVIEDAFITAEYGKRFPFQYKLIIGALLGLFILWGVFKVTLKDRNKQLKEARNEYFRRLKKEGLI